MADILEIRRPDDMHTHQRQDDMLHLVLPHTARVFARAIVMPNLKPAILTAADMRNYRFDINRTLRSHKIEGFEPLMSFKIVPATTVDTVFECKQSGAMIGKMFPDGVTTNSEGGVRDFKAMYDVFDTMQQIELILSIHCEMPGRPNETAEQEFIPVLNEIIRNFPRLKVIVEHVSSKDMVDWVFAGPDTVAGTITPHHMILTATDADSNPHCFCKPKAKTEDDRQAVHNIALSGDPKFFFGSDTAPHPESAKLGNPPMAGYWNAPVALPLVAYFFDQAGKLDRMENFVSRFGAEFYGLPLNEGTIKLRLKPNTVPKKIGNVVPFMAGETLDWEVII